MAENGDDKTIGQSISTASSETQKLLDKVFEKLGKGASDQGPVSEKLPELFPNGVTNISIELSLGLTSTSPNFSVKLQISGPPNKAMTGAPDLDRLPEPQALTSPVRFRIRRHTNATPVLDNARADEILKDGTELLKTVDGSDDVSCTVDLGRDGAVDTFSVGNGIINSQKDYDAVCGESTHSHRIYIVNQILFCGGNKPDPGFVFIGCSDTPGGCMILVRTDEAEEPVLWMHEYGHNRGLNHRNNNFAVMNGTIETDHRRVNAAERDAYQGGVRFMSPAQDETPQPTDRPKNVRDFVHQKFIHGVPYEEASSYPRDVIPELLEMLEDPREERYWPNIAATICMIGDPRSIEPLVRFIRSGEGTLSRYEYDAKTVALMNLGFLIRKSGVDDASDAFNYLREGLNPETWRNEIGWRNPYNLNHEEQNVQLAKVAVWGLALTGAPEAAEVLRSFQRDRINAELAEREAGVQSLSDLAEEALRYHATISK